jgi:putative tricarboxylic transport membrane protein
MQEKRNDMHSSIALFLFGVFIFVGSFWIPATTSDVLGSRFFPRAVAIFMCILSAIQFMEASVELKKLKDSGVKEEKEKAPISKPFLLTTIALFVYYILIRGIGFTLTSIIYLIFEGLVLMTKKERSDKKSVAVLLIASILVPIFVNFIFWNIFSIQLPEGSLFE